MKTVSKQTSNMNDFDDVKFGILCTLIYEEHADEFEKLGVDSEEARDALLKYYMFQHLDQLRDAKKRKLNFDYFGVKKFDSK